MKVFTKILTGVLTVLGFSTLPGCVMYGSPEGVYQLTVEVVDESTQKPIEDLKVILKSDRSYSYVHDIRLTDERGYAFVVANGLFAKDVNFTLIIEDLNGEVGGLYQRDSSQIKVYASDFKGGSGKYDGGRAYGSVKRKLTKVK